METALKELDAYREEIASCALRWSAQGVLQQAWRIERFRNGELIGVGMEWRDVVREGA